MKRFKNILYYVDGQTESSPTLERAMKLAESNHARLTLVDVIEPVETPDEIEEHFHIQLNDILADQRQQVLEELVSPYASDDALIYTRVLSGLSFIEVIRFVQSGGYDLVIKQARPPAGISERLFGSHDMHLLRKCPCPVLIDKPDTEGHYNKVLASVDPTPGAEHQTDKLVMDLASSLAQREEATLDVMHAWHMQGESMFRSGRFRLATAELELMLDHQERSHRDSLASLLEPYDLSPDHNNVHLLKGQAAKTIRDYVEKRDVDIIVMGTVGRVGIPGFFIGNTAEEVLQTTDCSVLAVKPEGFVSPVK